MKPNRKEEDWMDLLNMSIYWEDRPHRALVWIRITMFAAIAAAIAAHHFLPVVAGLIISAVLYLIKK
jgi:hypothetical protein